MCLYDAMYLNNIDNFIWCRLLGRFDTTNFWIKQFCVGFKGVTLAGRC